MPRLYVNTEKLEEGITIDPHGFGMSTLSAVAGNPAIKILAVEGVYASPATIADGSYPLYSPLYFAAREDGRNKEAVQKFVQYADSDAGRAILRKHDIVPYGDAADLVNKQDARVAFVDAHVHPDMITTSMGSRPVSAPNATADLLSRTAPTSQEALQAREAAARVNAEKAKKGAPVTPDGD